MVTMLSFISKSALIMLLTIYSQVANSGLYASENRDDNPYIQLEERVLVVHSYGSNSEWSQSIQRGVTEANQHLVEPFELYAEYFDGSRLQEQQYVEKFSRYLNIKYSDIVLDSIVLVDDYAAQLLPHIEEIIDVKPVYLLGVSHSADQYLDIDLDIHIHYDEYDVVQITNKLIATRPDLTTIHFVVDRSIVGEFLYQSIKKHLDTNLPSIRLQLYRDRPLEGMLASLENSTSPQDAVLLGPYNTETQEGIFYSDHILAKSVAQSSNAPVYSFWDNYIFAGVVGGYTVAGDSQGALVIEMLAQRFDKQYVDELVYTLPKGKAVYNYDALLKHDIYLNQLPSDAVIFNRPYLTLRDDIEKVLILAFIAVVCVYAVATHFTKRQLTKKREESIMTVQRFAFESQKDMIYAMGEAIECRSGETGQHVKRVAQMSSFIAKLYGLNDYECQLLEIVSPMHDIGKISISEDILNKPGKLTNHEFDIIKEHTSEGYKLLSASNGHLMQMAAIVAHEHHEKWNGTGYPCGKKGEEIHIYGRITAIADVMDALLSSRPYKNAWPESKVIELLESESNEHFQPELVELVLENFFDIIAVRNRVGRTKNKPLTRDFEFALQRPGIITN